MHLERENDLLRAFFSSTEKDRSLPAYESLLREAERAGCRGATVFRGAEGLDARGRVLRPGAFSLAEEVPVVVEVIDAPGRIDGLVRRARRLLAGRMATRERAEVIVYRARAGGAHPPVPAPAAEEGPMPEEREGVLVRVFASESDRHGGRPLVREILDRAVAAGLAGAVVLKSPLGFGAHRTERSAKIETAALGQPVVIELMDEEPKIRAFLPRLDEVLLEGLVTLEKVRILRFGDVLR